MAEEFPRGDDVAEDDSVRAGDGEGTEKEAAPETPESPTPASAQEEPSGEAPEPDGTSPASDTRDGDDQELDEAEDLDVAKIDERNRLREESLANLGHDPDEPIRLARYTPRGAGATGPKTSLGDGTAAETIINNYQSADRAKSARSHQLDPPWLVSRAHRYADNGQLATLRAALDSAKLMCLTGEEGTGRRATAYQAAVVARGRNNVYVIDLDEGATLSSVLDTDGVLHKDGAHVVELYPAQKPPNQNVLAVLSGKLSQLNAVLIVICPRTGPFGTIGAFAVEHQPPDLDMVLYKQLAGQLGIPDSDPTINTVKTEYIERCLDSPKIKELVAKPAKLAEVVFLANELRDTLARGGDPEDALSKLPSEQRNQARKALRRQEKDDDATAVRRFSIVTAGAAFAGSPPNVISAATELLSDILFPRSDGERRKQRVAFRVTDDLSAEGLTAAAALDVIWHDLDDARDSLLPWLDMLSGDRRELVRVRVGQLAGQLATYDFTRVYQALLRPWAESPRAARRQIAAWAIERALLYDAMTGRVRRQVTDWVLSRNQYLMDTAARVLATPQGASLIDDPWLYLWLVTLYVSEFETASVAEAVTRLVREPNPQDGCRETLDTLTEWLDDNEDRTWARVHIAKALLFVAQLPGEQDPNGSALLSCAKENDDAWAKHLRLWLVALTEQATTNAAFLGIELWLTRADGNAELETIVTDFVRHLAKRPDIRKRIVFNLRRWASKHEQLPIFQNLLNNL